VPERVNVPEPDLMKPPGVVPLLYQSEFFIPPVMFSVLPPSTVIVLLFPVTPMMEAIMELVAPPAVICSFQL